MLDENLTHVHYTKCSGGSDLPLFLPTTNNSYGEVMRQYVEKVFRLGAKGVFHVRDMSHGLRFAYLTSDVSLITRAS